MFRKKEIIKGRIGKDPRVTYTTKHQTPICRFEIATSIDGVDLTVWRKVKLQGKKASDFSVQAKKGMKVFIEGIEKLVQFRNKAGEDIEYLEFNGEAAAIEV